jgi:hypothetical protein
VLRPGTVHYISLEFVSGERLAFWRRLISPLFAK